MGTEDVKSSDKGLVVRL